MDLKELAAQYAAEVAESGQEATQRQTEERIPAALQREQEQRTEAGIRALEICREYQENKRASNSAQSLILKGIQAGENPYRLLLTACDCIGRLTSNRNFVEQVRGGVEDISGKGLMQPEALEIELEGIRSRLAMLTRTELESEPGETRRRIGVAIRAHQKRAGEIEKVLRDRAEAEDRERLLMAQRAAKLERMEADPAYRAQVEAEQQATLRALGMEN